MRRSKATTLLKAAAVSLRISGLFSCFGKLDIYKSAINLQPSRFDERAWRLFVLKGDESES
jgi:hypothetical protein